MLLVIYGINHLFETNTPTQRSWTTFQSVMYNCFSKTLWSLSLGWIIFSCHKGYGGLINNFLSWKVWMPISKLTYGAYLIHPVLQKIVLTGITSTIKYSTFFWVMNIYWTSIDSSSIQNLFIISVPIIHWGSLLCLWFSLCPLPFCWITICSIRETFS